MDLERTAEPRERRLASGTGLAAPGSHVVHGAQGLGAAQPGPSSQGALEPSRRHSPSGTGAHACAGSDSTMPAQPEGPGSPSEGRGCVSPVTHAAGARHPLCSCASAGFSGRPPGSSVSSSAVSDAPQSPSQSAARRLCRGACLEGKQRLTPGSGWPSAAVTSPCPLGAQGSGSSLNPQWPDRKSVV